MKKIRKIKKTSTKDNFEKLKTKDNSFIICEISLDDKANQEYFDILAYEEYLRNLNSKGGGFSDEQ